MMSAWRNDGCGRLRSAVAVTNQLPGRASDSSCDVPLRQRLAGLAPVTRHLSYAFVGICAAFLLTGSASWACVPQPFVVIKPGPSGPAGTQVTVDGQNFIGRTELRWNGIDGPLLGIADGNSFSVPITIPDTAAGLYVLLALAREPGGGSSGATPASFEVVSQSPGLSSEAARPPRSQPDAESTRLVPVAIGVGASLCFVSALAGARLARRRSRPVPPPDD